MIIQWMNKRINEKNNTYAIRKEEACKLLYSLQQLQLGTLADLINSFQQMSIE
jgi:hypothetical protein